MSPSSRDTRGRSERSSSISEEVVTTEVRPRCRPEVRKLELPSSLPPPPLLAKRRIQSFDMSGGQKINNPDLISFTSPCPLRNGSSSKQDLEDIKFDNNNAAKKE